MTTSSEARTWQRYQSACDNDFSVKLPRVPPPAPAPATAGNLAARLHAFGLLLDLLDAADYMKASSGR